MQSKQLIYVIVVAALFSAILFARVIQPQSNQTMNQTVLARPLLSSINQTILSDAMAQVNCKTNLTVKFLDSVVSEVPNTSSALSPMVTTIQQDTSQLQSYASAGNGASFRSYVTGTYDPELKTIRTSWVPALKAQNVTRSTLLLLRSQYNTSKSTYETCAYDSLRSYANEKVAAYQSEVAQYAQTVAKLNAKGIPTAQENLTLDSANTTIIIPLQNAIDNATNESQMRDAINSYCLFDGCPGGVNAHLAAHFDLEMITGILGKAQTLNSTKNQTANLTAVQNYLNIASSTLQTVGTQPYSGSQSSTIWGNLKNASVELRHILKGK